MIFGRAVLPWTDDSLDFRAVDAGVGGNDRILSGSHSGGILLCWIDRRRGAGGSARPFDQPDLEAGRA